MSDLLERMLKNLHPVDGREPKRAEGVGVTKDKDGMLVYDISCPPEPKTKEEIERVLARNTITPPPSKYKAPSSLSTTLANLLRATPEELTDISKECSDDE